MSKITLLGAKLHPGQLAVTKAIFNSKCFYHTIVSPRQWGKSFFCCQLMLAYALNNPNSKLMYCSPTYAQAAKNYKEIIAGIQDSGLIKKFNGAENSIIFVNGSELFFKSVMNADNLRGYSINYMFLDECSSYKESIFNTVLRPMLSTIGKNCFLFSTPKGKSNFFYDMYMKGIDPNEKRYASYKCVTADNPFANLDEIADAKKVLPDSVFRQEYEAEFIDDGGDVFQNISKNALISEWREPQPGKIYYAGVDLGRQSDYTVCTILDQAGNICYIYRRNKTEWGNIMDDLIALLDRYRPRKCLLEVNGLGDVIYSTMRQRYKNIEPWVTTNESKQNAIESLLLAFEDMSIKIPTVELFEPLHSELSDFTFTYSKKTRRIMYAARTGHDDIIMATAIAWQAKTTGATKGLYAIR